MRVLYFVAGAGADAALAGAGADAALAGAGAFSTLVFLSCFFTSSTLAGAAGADAAGAGALAGSAANTTVAEMISAVAIRFFMVKLLGYKKTS